MKNSITFILLLSCIFTYSQWVDLNFGITDNLTGIVFNQNMGLVSGENGLYYTLNGGNGSDNWSRFEITDNTVDAEIYNNINFTNCYTRDNSNGALGSIYACGQHSDGNAIIMRIELPSLEYQIIKILFTNAPLYDIDYRTNKYFAVGGNGMIISFDNNGYDFGYSTVDDETFYSIDFALNSPVAMIGSDNKYYKLNTDSYNFEEILTPGIINKDVRYSSKSYSVGNNYVKYYSGNTTINNNFDYGSLNANCFVKVNGFYSKHLVGTDHGIFKSDEDKDFLEWQPSSLNYNIKSLWSETSSLAYACGVNGIILKTQNQGGSTKPYVVLDFDGGCINQNIRFDTLTYGTSTNCQWYVDDVLFYTDCNSFYHTFNQTGEYAIKLIGTNDYGIQTEKTKIISIVNPPEINKPTIIEDQILCQEEQLNIQIENSEPNVFYILRKSGDNNNYGESNIGNSGTLSFLSNLISTSGEFYLEAVNISAPNCTTSFTETINVVVEKTNADFYVDLINADIDEEVLFYEKSTEAQNFEWTFPSNANTQTSNDSFPNNSFTSSGQTIVNLVASSDNDCVDEISLPGPNIIEVQNENHCWTFINNGEDRFINASESYEITDLTKTDDGFLTSGYYADQTFGSNRGNSFFFSGEYFGGGFISKHDKFGTLKWFVYTEQFGNSNGKVYSSVSNQLGEIYISGYQNAGSFYDNTRHKIDLDGSYLIKLDSKGNLIWYLKGFSSRKLSLDNYENVVCLGPKGNGSSDIYLNDVLSGVIGETITSQPTNNFMAKFSPEGMLIWDTGIYLKAVNGQRIKDIGHDINNNIYITGSFEQQADFYSTGSTVPNTLYGIFGDYGQKLFLAKYDEHGNFLWKLRSVINGVDNGTTEPKSIVVDNEGNSYITGRNNCNNTSKEQVFNNVDGSTTSKSLGGFYIAKVDTNGICQWIRGAAYSNYGFGYKVIKDNNEIYIAGSVSNYDGTTTNEQVDFISTNNNNLTITINKNDFFIAVYDFDGNLKRIIVNGENDLPFSRDSIVGFFKDDYENAFYLAEIISIGGTENYISFGNIISPSEVNGSDGVVTRFTENCGIVYFPSTASITSIADFEFNIFPNPVEDYIKIKSKTKILKTQLYNKFGQLILESNSEENINVSNLSNDLYFLKINDLYGNTEIKKIIKI